MTQTTTCFRVIIMHRDVGVVTVCSYQLLLTGNCHVAEGNRESIQLFHVIPWMFPTSSASQEQRLRYLQQRGRPSQAQTQVSWTRYSFRSLPLSSAVCCPFRPPAYRRNTDYRCNRCVPDNVPHSCKHISAQGRGANSKKEKKNTDIWWNKSQISK